MNTRAALFTGATAGRIAWTEGEDEILRRLYPRASWAELFSSLPGRGLKSIHRRAFALGAKREKREYPPGFMERQSKRLRERPIRLGTGNPHEVRDGVDGKRCFKCGDWRPIDHFAKHGDCPDGRRNVCRACDSENSSKWKRENPARAVATARRWQIAHPAHFKSIKRAANIRRHGRMVEGRVTARELRNRHSEFNGRCGYCLAPADTDDHMTPLSRGGRHEIENIIPACRACNFRKHTKTVLEVLLQGL